MTSAIHLQALWNFEQEQLDKNIKDFIREWNRQHKCICCKNWKEKDDLIECEHMQKQKIKKFRQRNIKQFVRILSLRFIDLKSFR